jgi:hypothetical protein
MEQCRRGRRQSRSAGTKEVVGGDPLEGVVEEESEVVIPSMSDNGGMPNYILY